MTGDLVGIRWFFSPPKIWCPTCKLSIFSISSCDVGSFDIRCQAYQKLRLGRLGVILRGYHPPKFNECPLKSDYFNRKYIWTNHYFQGTFVRFQGCSWMYPDPNLRPLRPLWLKSQKWKALQKVGYKSPRNPGEHHKYHGYTYVRGTPNCPLRFLMDIPWKEL